MPKNFRAAVGPPVAAVVLRFQSNVRTMQNIFQARTLEKPIGDTVISFRIIKRGAGLVKLQAVRKAPRKHVPLCCDYYAAGANNLAITETFGRGCNIWQLKRPDAWHFDRLFLLSNGLLVPAESTMPRIT